MKLKSLLTWPLHDERIYLRGSEYILESVLDFRGIDFRGLWIARLFYAVYEELLGSTMSKKNLSQGPFR